MGGKGSGRKSEKGMAINAMLDVQIMLNELRYDDLDSDMTRDQLKAKVEEKIQKLKVAQEELERQCPERS